MTGLRIEDVHVTWPGQPAAALSGVTVAVEPGRTTVIVGPSGSGKSTLLRVAAGLVAPDSGRVSVGGRDVTDLPPERRGVTMMVQETLLFPHMTVAGNVGFGLRMRGAPAREVAAAVDGLLERVRLPGFGPRRTETLSGGQAQRVALARALAVRPDVLLLDEPLAALDPSLRAELRETIVDLGRTSGTALLFVTHDREEAVAVGDRIVLLLDGRVTQDGSPEDLFERPRSVAVARFLGDTNLLEGWVSGGRLTGPFGTLACDPSWPEGPAQVTIRPEFVGLRGEGDGLPATVTAVRYRGTHRLVEAMAGQARILAALPPAEGRDLRPGATVGLSLPAERLWRLPEA
jgi:ABC-type Fe3+/spermidine/putrescine transport system ATPase subunit